MQTTERWQPKPEHQRYHQALRQLGCLFTGETEDIQLHHCDGASCRHNKVWIGQWWVLVLRRDFHDNRAGQIYNVTDNKNGFQLLYGTQQEIWLRQYHRLVGAVALGEVKLDIKDLPPDDVVAAIASYRR